MEQYDIFISYRRLDGIDYARILQKALELRGYKVFLDCEELADGTYGERIRNAIKDASVFMMVLSPQYLDRCKYENDWVRQEIMVAIQQKKYVIPINPNKSFNGFPDGIPEDIKRVVGSYQFAEVDFGEFFEASIDKIVNIRILNKTLKKVTKSHDIFLAYPRKDLKAGEKLSQIIQSNGFSVWHDFTGIMAGEQFEDCIINAISNSKAFIALYSSWALESKWFKKELEYAQIKQIPIIKVLTETPEGLSGTRRMTFGTMLEMGGTRFDEKLLSTILNNGCKPDTTEMLTYGKELYDNAKKTNNVQAENAAFLTLMRAAELGDREALSYIDTHTWETDLKQIVSRYRPINSYFVEDLRADLYNRGEIIAEDPTLTDVEQRGRGMEKAAFRMMKRAIDLGFEGSDPTQYSWYYLTKDDFEECLDQLGKSSRIYEKVKQKVLVSSKPESQQEKTPYMKDRKPNSSKEKGNQRVFISYKRVDKEKVFEIKKTIESVIGEECWIDLDGIESDAQFAKVIIGAINRSVVFLFMYSFAHAAIEDYENDWTVRELNFAQKKRKRIVFINIDGSELTDWFEMIFGTKQQIDASSDILMNNLYSDLKKWLNVGNVPSSPEKSQNSHSSQDNKEDSFEDSIELQLAWMEYNDGNYKEALRSFLLEAKKGSANALNAIGIYYYEGKACTKNYQQAMSYFQKAADKGYASAMRNLGDCYRWGHGVKQDVDKSIFWYKKAAEKKNLKAIYLLAHCYRDIAPWQADQYYLEAAHMGHEEAIKYVISHGLAKHENDIKWHQDIPQSSINKDYEELQKDDNIKVGSKKYKKVFISYAHKDRDKVKYLAAAFDASGVECFFDRDYLKGGELLPQIVQEYIRFCDLFVLCWSANAAKSEYVKKEYQYALSLAYPQKKMEEATLRIYPISIEPRAELPEDMKDIYHFGEL